MATRAKALRLAAVLITCALTASCGLFGSSSNGGNADVERNVIRIALYELLHCENVPVNVVLNEAIELAKRYGTAEGAAFTNGLLDRAVGELGVRR